MIGDLVGSGGLLLVECFRYMVSLCGLILVGVGSVSVVGLESSV